MSTPVLVGRDVAVYNIAPYGADGFPVLGSYVSMLGRWKSITIEGMNEWQDVSSSDANFKEKRLIIRDFRATLGLQVRSFAGGSLGTKGMQLLYTTDTVAIVFTEEISGKTFGLLAGISRDTMKRDRGEAEDTLEVEGVGLDGAFVYAL